MIEERDRPSFADRRVTVMGLGLFGGGAGVARFLALAGADVTVTDLRGPDALAPSLAALEGLDVRLVLGEHRDEDFEEVDIVVANPAVSPANAFLARARQSGARVTSEIELFLERVPARLACVTGTQGKSSVCHFLGILLRACGVRVHVGGNLGGSLLEASAEMAPDDLVVLELSSYQLEALSDPPPRARVEAVGITNVLADHLDRHGSREAYAAAKLRILELARPGGTAVLPADLDGAIGEDLRVLRLETPSGLCVVDGVFRCGDVALGSVRSAGLPAFQSANVLAALGLAHALGARPHELADALPELASLPHRMQDLGLVAGHRVWDNAVSTTPDSTIGALFEAGEGCTLVCGGRPKGLTLAPLFEVAARRVGRAIVFGEAAEDLARGFAAAGIPVDRTACVGDAVRLALSDRAPGADVVFSPAFSSFDAYPNFLARAQDFLACVEDLRTRGAS